VVRVSYLRAIFPTQSFLKIVSSHFRFAEGKNIVHMSSQLYGDGGERQGGRGLGGSWRSLCSESRLVVDDPCGEGPLAVNGEWTLDLEA
jgi:hypothetical protein